MRDIGSLIFETPIQHDYEASVKVRSRLSTERLEEMDDRLAVTDEDPHAPGVRCVKFWVDDAPGSPTEGRNRMGEEVPSRASFHQKRNPTISKLRDSRAPISPERRERTSQIKRLKTGAMVMEILISVEEWGIIMVKPIMGDPSLRAFDRQ